MTFIRETMKNFIPLYVFLIITSSNIFSQLKYDWDLLSNSPNANSRFNDAFFITPDLGWIVNGRGQIYKTENGGESWEMKFEKSNAHFRSIGFTDSLHGWAGNVGLGEFNTNDTTLLYKTIDGGESWIPVTGIALSAGSGICGMHVLDDKHIYAVGRVRGPAVFVKTTNGGESWVAKNMGSFAAGLIDVHFFSPDTGFAVGLTSATHSQSSGIVLVTFDGGKTWEEKHRSSQTGEWIWKINFPSRNIGYASLQRNSGGPTNFLKTTDGGMTWTDKLFQSQNYFVQGIGFANDTLGWIGGNSSNPTYQTTDGGETWEDYPFGSRVNRFRMLNDTVGYAVGDRVYKFEAESPLTSIAENSELIPSNYSLSQNYPNPFNPVTTIKYSIPASNKIHSVQLKVFDLLGNEMAVLVDSEQAFGEYSVEFDASNLSSGIYFYRLQAGNYYSVKKLILMK
jgi:photosystem II stability/assembly factor-like uncharacterized protein